MIKNTVIMLALSCALMLGGCAGDYEKGADHLSGQEYEEAVESFTQAVDSGKNVADSYRGLGIAYWEQEEYDLAEEAFKNALSSGAEESASLYALLGNTQMKLEEYEAAIDSYEKGIGAGDASEDLAQEMAFNQAAAYEKLGDIDHAREKFQAYTEKYPEDADAAKEAEFLETR